MPKTGTTVIGAPIQKNIFTQKTMFYQVENIEFFYWYTNWYFIFHQLMKKITDTQVS